MNIQLVVSIICIVVAIVAVSITVYLYIRDNTLADLRVDVYQLFLKAEHMYMESSCGKQKMKWVICQARGLLPDWAKMFISESTLEYVIQLWFDAVKDLLDDGKYNKSVEKESEVEDHEKEEPVSDK